MNIVLSLDENKASRMNNLLAFRPAQPQQGYAFILQVGRQEAFFIIPHGTTAATEAPCVIVLGSPHTEDVTRKQSQEVMVGAALNIGMALIGWERCSSEVEEGLDQEEMNGRFRAICTQVHEAYNC